LGKKYLDCASNKTHYGVNPDGKMIIKKLTSMSQMSKLRLAHFKESLIGLPKLTLLICKEGLENGLYKKLPMVLNGLIGIRMI
jgi:hypothetical protein